MDKVRVCHIITRLDVGGAAENTLRSVCGLDPSRYEVSLIYGRTDNPLTSWLQRAKEQGVSVYSLPCMVREVKPLADLRAFGQLCGLLSRIQPHIVHTHSSKAGILGRWAAKLQGVPYLIHTPHGHIFYGYYNAARSWFFRTMEKVTAWFTDRIITLTDEEQRHHLDAKIGRPAQFRTIHSGVEIERFAQVSVDRHALRQRFQVPQEASCIGSAGRLVEVKDFGLLLEAVALLHRKRPDHYHLVLLGEGAERGMLLNKSMELGIHERFHLPGWFEDIENYYPAFDLFVLSSRNEGMGRVLVEAMAAGIPVVATAVGGVPELLQQGECGLLVPPGRPDLLAEAINAVFYDPDLRRNMVEKGKVRARQYTVAAMIEKLNRLYEELVPASGK